METQDLNDIGDSGISDMRPIILVMQMIMQCYDGKDHLLLWINMILDEGNRNDNVEDYLEWLCTEVELKSGLTARS